MAIPAPGALSRSCAVIARALGSALSPYRDETLKRLTTRAAPPSLESAPVERNPQTVNNDTDQETS
jgi:hypothetical protein